MDISFIIPVFNCQKDLPNCLESILNVNGNYEIILINDGSKDDSLSICELYSRKYANIKFISQENKGASSARNAGLDIAKGDYIWFVDADDKINEGIYPELIKVLEKNPEIVCFNYKSIFENSCISNIEWNHCEHINGIKYLEDMHTMYLWNKLYRRDVVRNIRFVDGTKNIEDMYFNLCVIQNANDIMVLPYIGYNYVCITNTSTSRNRSKRNLIKLAQDSHTIQENIIDDIKQASNAQIKQILYNYLNLSLLGHIFSLVQFYNFKRIRKTIVKYKEWNVYPIGETNNKRANLFAKIANHSSLLYLFFIMHKIVKRKE